MSLKTKILTPMIVITLISTSIILLSTVFLFSGFVDRNIEADLDRAMLHVFNQIESLKANTRYFAIYTASDNAIMSALKNNNQEELINRAVEIYEDSKLTVLVITDERGVVLAHGHFPDIHGDDIIGRIAIDSALAGRTETLVEFSSIIPLVVISGIPIHCADGVLTGAAIVGYRMDTDEFVDNLKMLSGHDITIFVDNKRVSTTLIGEDGNRAVGTEAPENIIAEITASGQSVTGLLRMGGREMLARYLPLFSCCTGEIIGVLSVKRDLTERTGMIRSFITVGLAVLTLLFAISIPVILFVTGRIADPITESLDQLHYDVLTGIYNRRFFDENLKRVIRSLARSGNPLSLIMIDIDFFKKYNDTYGHKKGDECLKLVAKALEKSVNRADDFVARYGGEEFAVVLPNTGEIGAHLVADKILESIKKLNIPHEASDAASRITVSAGITSGMVDQAQSGGDYVNRADEMLYASKQNGRNRYSYMELAGASPMTLSSAKKTIDTLRQNKKMADTLREMAVSLLSKRDISFESIMNSGVVAVVDFMRVDRLSVWRNSKKPDGFHISQIYRWDRDSGGTTPPLEGLVDITYAETVPSWGKVLSSGGVINGSLRLMSDFESDLLESYGVVSVFAAPVFIDDAFWGFVLFVDAHTERSFDDDAAEIMRSTAVLFASAVIRAEITAEIEDSLLIAHEANRAKSNFLMNMNHEMLTPMNAILGMTQIAKMPNRTEEQLHHCINEIDKASRRLLKLINDLLDASGSNGGGFKLSESNFSFGAAVSKILEETADCLAEKQHTFSYDIDPSIPPSLTGDEKRLRQVIAYLLSNAAKFTDNHGQIHLSFSAADNDGEKITLQVSVTDNGIGIQKEHQSAIFSIFEQVDGSISRKYDGTGMGLPIAKRIVEMMGGNIWVESELGKGAKFTFTCRLKL